MKTKKNVTNKWYDYWNEVKPENGQAVIYYFEIVGVHRGFYDDSAHCFHGSRGFLCSDVTHWMPDDGRDELPPPPVNEGL